MRQSHTHHKVTKWFFTGRNVFCVSLFSLLFLSAALPACSDQNYEAATPPPPAPGPAPAPGATPGPGAAATPLPHAPGLDLSQSQVRESEKPFWVASANQRFVVGYSPTGQVQKIVDLARTTGQTTGGVTALAFVAPGVLAAFVDPQVPAGAESLVLIDTVEGQLKNTQWYRDPDHLNQVQVRSMDVVAPGQLLVTTNAGVENVGFNGALAFRIAGLGGGAFVPSQVPGEGSCAFGTLTAGHLLTPVTPTGTPRFLMLAQTGVHRLGWVENVAQVPRCAGSWEDRGVAGITAEETPVAAVQEKESVYVLYQSPTHPQIVRFTFDGRGLVDPTLIFDDRAVLGSTPSALISFMKGVLLVANPETGALAKISTDGSFEGFLVKDSFTAGVSAVAIESGSAAP